MKRLAGILFVFATALAAQPENELRSVTLILGGKDAEPSSWDGSASISSGSIERIKGYHFREEDRVLDGNAWECATHPWPTNQGGMHPNERAQPHQTLVIPTGVTIEYRAPEDAEIEIKLTAGEFRFRPSEILENGAIFPLRGRIEVHHTPVVEKLTGEQGHDDYSSIAADGDDVWVAWTSWDGSEDRVFLRRRSNGEWAEAVEASGGPGDYFGTAVAAGGGQAMVVWSEHQGEAWHLKYRIHNGSNLGATGTITSGEGKNLFHRAAAGPDGAFHVVYQSTRRGRSDIYLRSYKGGAWGEELMLSDPKRPARANDWSPDVAVDSAGTVWAAWDGYARGSYNIYLRSARNGNVGALTAVTNTDRFHAHPSLAVDRHDRVWIAWDQGPENWGKDVGFLLTGGTGLYEARQIHVVAYSAGQWMEPLQQPDEVVPWGYKRYFHTPELAADGQGRVWLFARPRTQCRIPHKVWAAGGKWEVVATYYTEDGWADIIPIPDSVSGNEGSLSAAADEEGNVYTAFLTDNRLWGGGNFGEKPGDHDIQFARLRASGPSRLLVTVRRQESPTRMKTEILEEEQIARLRDYEINNEGATYKIYRGDLHRHTDHSTDGSGDGSLWDSYRYALDAADMDYLLVTDHHSHLTDYYYHRNEKAADMFNVPEFFTAFWGYERSLSYPNGHRNVILAKRDVPMLMTAPGEGPGETNTGPVLYPYLRKYNGLTTSHTSATGMGTDWRDNDQSLEPIVELFQGARTSAEHEGAPLAPKADETHLHAGGYRPLGFLWNAWEKGYKLGVQASSDHVSTHTSYACIIARDGTREELMDAMRKRHTYAATSNIIMDYQVAVDGKDYLQGDILTAGSLPRIAARIIGTGELKEVVVVRDNEYVYSTRPGEETFLLNFQETGLEPGEHYYYVRAEQVDGNVAWSSPVWITYE